MKAPPPIEDVIDALEGSAANPENLRILRAVARHHIDMWEHRDRCDGYLPNFAQVGIAFALASIDASNAAENALLVEAATFAAEHLRGSMTAVRRAIARRSKAAPSTTTPPTTGGDHAKH